MLVLIWLAGTFVAVVLATSAVGIVGNRVSTDPVTRVGDDTEESALETSTTTSDPAAPSPDSVAPDASPEITEVPPPGSTGGIVFPGAAAPADAAPAPSAPGPATTLAPSAPTPATAVVRRTFSGPGGTVGAECNGSVIGLLYATPSAGYEIHGAMDTGPGEIDVRFRPVEGGDEWRLRARCESGAPVERTDG